MHSPLATGAGCCLNRRMSKMHDELTGGKPGETAWYLQVEDEDIYGPVPLSELQEWARQGRIAPENRLSRDRTNWEAAAEIEALAMNWLILLPDGETYGPICRDLIPELVKRNFLEPEMIARHRHTGEQKPVSAMLKPAAKATPGQPELPLDGEDLPAAPMPPPPARPMPAPVKRPSPETPPPPVLSPELPEDAEEPLPTGGEALTQRLQTLQRSARQARTQLADSRRELTQQRADNTALQDRLRKLEEDLNTAEKQRRQSDEALAAQEDRATAAEADLENLQAQLEQLQNHYDRLQVESQEQFELLDKTRAELMQLEQTSNQERAEFETRMNTKTGLLQQAIRCILRDPDVQTADLPERLLETPREQAVVQKLSEQLDFVRAQLQKAEARAEKSEARTAKAGTVHKRRWRPAAIVLLILVGAVGLYRVGQGRHPLFARVSGGDAGRGAPEPALGHMPAHPVPMTSRRETHAALPAVEDWPRLDLERTRLRISDREYAIIYTYGLFERGSVLSEQAVADLAVLADRLRPNLERFNLVVEGHTDATPVSASDGRYVDNFALGMARANAVGQLLQRRHGIPEASLFTTSAGDSDPPYANDTEESRRRNRTVIFKLIPKR